MGGCFRRLRVFFFSLTQSITPGNDPYPLAASPAKSSADGLIGRHRPCALTGATSEKAHYVLSSRLFSPCKGKLVGRAGVEPTTNGLKVRCSTN